MGQKVVRSDLQTISYVKDLIQKCIEAAKNGEDTEKQFTDLRSKLHEMEYYDFLNSALIQKSKVLEPKVLSEVFEGPDKE